MAQKALNASARHDNGDLEPNEMILSPAER